MYGELGSERSNGRNRYIGTVVGRENLTKSMFFLFDRLTTNSKERIMSEETAPETPKAPPAPAPAATPVAEPITEPMPVAEPVPEKPTGVESPKTPPTTIPEDHMGKRIAKKFRKKHYYGEVTELWSDEADGSPRWHIKYDDGDEEDFDAKELDSGLKLYEKAQQWDRKVNPAKPRAPRKRKDPVRVPPRSNKYPKRRTESKN